MSEKNEARLAVFALTIFIGAVLWVGGPLILGFIRFIDTQYEKEFNHEYWKGPKK